MQTPMDTDPPPQNSGANPPPDTNPDPPRPSFPPLGHSPPHTHTGSDTRPHAAPTLSSLLLFAPREKRKARCRRTYPHRAPTGTRRDPAPFHLFHVHRTRRAGLWRKTQLPDMTQAPHRLSLQPPLSLRGKARHGEQGPELAPTASQAQRPSGSSAERPRPGEQEELRHGDPSTPSLQSLEQGRPGLGTSRQGHSRIPHSTRHLKSQCLLMNKRCSADLLLMANPLRGRWEWVAAPPPRTGTGADSLRPPSL